MSVEGHHPVKQHFKVFLFTDLVGSVALHERVGGVVGAQIGAKNNELFRECLEKFDGELIDTAGDGCFASFERPSDALRCALHYIQGLAHLDVPERLRARAGIHMGEVAETAGGGLVGVAIDTASRVMGLAETDQILLTRHAFDSVRQFVDAGPDGSPIEWQTHGSYRFKGLEDPIEIFEAGVKGVAALRSPSDKPPNAQRVGRVAAEEEWWPAVGLEIPTRKNWILQKKLGEGSIGEVWLAEHKKSLDRRIFKFCFQVSRLRTLQREATNFVYLKKTLGDREDIVRMLDWQFDRPPYFIESDYTAGGDLHEWAATRDGPLDEVPLETRLELVAEVAEALEAAHGVGVLHKDIKPSNILIAFDVGGRPRARLADFGIGLILDRDRFEELGITEVDLTQRWTEEFESTLAGTISYMAPEVIRGELVTTRSDVFSLGIVLFQMVVGNLKDFPAEGWTERIADEVLRDDIKACIQGDPRRRLPSAGELANRLRKIELRRAELEVRRAAERRERRGQRLRYYVAVLLLAVSLPAVMLAMLEISQWREAVGDSQRLVIDLAKQTNASAAHWLSMAIGRELDQACEAVERVAAQAELRRVLLCIGERVRGRAELAASEAQLREYLLEHDPDRAALQALLDAARQNSGSTLIFSWAINAGGYHCARSPMDEGVIGRSYTHRDWYHGLGAEHGDANTPITATHISEPFISSAKGAKPMVAVSTPVWHPDASPEQGSPIGVLLLTLTVEHFAEWLQDVPALASLGDTGVLANQHVEVVIINDRAQVIAHPMNPLIREPNQIPPFATWTDLPLVGTQTPGMAENHYDPIQNQTYLIGYSPVPRHNWLVIVQQPQEIVERPVALIARRVWQYGWVTLVVVSLVAGVLLVWLARTIARTLARHKEKTRSGQGPPLIPVAPLAGRSSGQAGGVSSARPLPEAARD